MAITTSGVYTLTLEKCLTNAAAVNLEGTIKAALVTDSYTPDFDTHDFWADASGNEVSGTGYSAGGASVTNPAVTAASPAAGQIKFDHDDVAWASSTITNAMALVGYDDAVTDDPLIYLLDFVTAATTSSATLTVTIASSGVFYADFVPG